MNPSSPPPVLIVGTGSMACLFAARLSAAGIPVTMLGSWPEGVTALLSDGVRLVEADGTERIYPVDVIQYSLELPRQATAEDPPTSLPQFPLALMLVKSWQTQRAADRLSDYLAPDGLVLTLQNGLGNTEVLAAALGRPRVLQGVTTLGATLLAPGQVLAAGEGPITLGEYTHATEMITLLQTAAFEVQTTADLASLVWGKLVINAAINPLTALLGISNGELLSHPTAQKLMPAAACEASIVASALGVRLPYDDPVATVEAVIRRTATNRSSMLQDVARSAPTEIDAINGAIVQAGGRVGVLTPVNSALWQLVKGL